MIRIFVHVDDSHHQDNNRFTMRTALAYPPEYDEVPVSSIDALESNVVAMHGELTDLKSDFKHHRTEFHAAIARLDNAIKAAVAELRAEIRAMAAKAARALKEFACRVDEQFREMRAEHKTLREKVDKNYDQLLATDKRVMELGAKLNAFFWVVGGLIAIATFTITVGKAVGWF